jgi:hypothetical protein
MTNYTLHQTPYGSIAVTVHGDGSGYCVPAKALVTNADGVSTPKPREYGEDQETIEINGVKYSYFRVALSTSGRYVLDTPYSVDFSKSARAKLQQWIDDNYAEIANPLRVAEAQLEQARYTASNLEQEFLKAQRLWQDAEREASEAYQRVADAKVGA